MVPVIMLSGFLGSGKTTLLRNLLEEAKRSDMNFGILINEIGQKDVDGQILENDGLRNLQTLTDGCVCCSRKSDLLKSFEELLRAKPDIIFVELTGLANAEEVMNELMRKELISRVYIEKMVTVIDSDGLIHENFAHLGERIHATYKKQVSVADIIVVNKLDLVDQVDRDRVESILRTYNEDAMILYTSYGNISLSSIAPNSPASNRQDPKLKSNSSGTTTNHEELELSYDYISTISIPVPIPVTKELIHEYLNLLKPNLIRAKGFVPFHEDGKTNLMQMVGNRVTWEEVAEFEHEHQLTLIGIELEAGRAFEQFVELTGKPIEELLMM